jgi:hypothetical protein
MARSGDHGDGVVPDSEARNVVGNALPNLPGLIELTKWRRTTEVNCLQNVGAPK